MQELNSIPSITKVSGASYLNSFQLRCISPNTLYNRTSGPICLTSDPEELSAQRKEQLKLLDHHIWLAWALAARQQDQADIQPQNIPIGAIVVFRQEEKELGSMKNRFSVGMITEKIWMEFLDLSTFWPAVVPKTRSLERKHPPSTMCFIDVLKMSSSCKAKPQTRLKR